MEKNEFEDIWLTCQETGCGKEFLFTAGEQRYFAERGFHTPKRCPMHRLQKRLRQKEALYDGPTDRR